MVALVFDIGSRVQVNFGKLIFSNIVDFRSGRKKTQKLPFLSLNFGFLYGQKAMMESYEYLTTPLQPIHFSIKEDNPIQEEEEKGKLNNAKRKTKASVTRIVAESITTKPKTESSSMPISSTGLA